MQEVRRRELRVVEVSVVGEPNALERHVGETRVVLESRLIRDYRSRERRYLVGERRSHERRVVLEPRPFEVETVDGTALERDGHFHVGVFRAEPPNVQFRKTTGCLFAPSISA
ncbi:hypothetical protein [Haladaptatus halobius]|uniref:hypothetical protein n=1 Tax=Haladaptatus halobius TaxID=2884875 RepID=UPI001D0BA838|nr:hypothetical protein [Haladaptatus halobius]